MQLDTSWHGFWNPVGSIFQKAVICTKLDWNLKMYLWQNDKIKITLEINEVGSDEVIQHIYQTGNLFYLLYQCMIYAFTSR